ncbi:type II CAAX endopeptidase family protein [Salinirubellus sp. GCM10025818]|uniref:CPBP family intramembrane glutamic endopeptidase n=1 Tax=Salinirubellus TaxID=2162630 RepID=UPI0030CAE3A1
MSRAAFLASGLWFAIDLVAQVGGAVVFEPVVGNYLVGSLVGVMLGFPIAAWAVVRYGQRHGVTPGDWGYDRTPRALLSGFIVGGGLVILNLTVVVTVTEAIFGQPEQISGLLIEGLAGGLPVVVLFLLAHGLVAPITEELAFRGVVQTALTREQGPLVGVLGAATLFSLKHILVDGSLERVLPVVVLALILGIVRERWGTGASTVTHATVNVVQGSLVLIAFL